MSIEIGVLPPGRWRVAEWNGLLVFACPDHEPRVINMAAEDGVRLEVLKPDTDRRVMVPASVIRGKYEGE